MWGLSGETMTVRLSSDTIWINESHSVGAHSEHVSVYLIELDDEYILIDSGSFHHRDSIKNAIDRVTDGDGIDALILSHSDYPHSGNVDEFRNEWEDVELIASSGSPAVQGLPADARKCSIGGELKVLGRKFSFIDPPLADRSHTTWIHDHESGILFAADGMGSTHTPADQNKTAAEIEGGISYEYIYEFHRDTLVWLRYVNPSKLRTAIEDILHEYHPTYIAPIHGHPIPDEAIDEYMEKLIKAAGQIAAEYEVSGQT